MGILPFFGVLRVFFGVFWDGIFGDWFGI